VQCKQCNNNNNNTVRKCKKTESISAEKYIGALVQIQKVGANIENRCKYRKYRVAYKQWNTQALRRASNQTVLETIGFDIAGKCDHAEHCVQVFIMTTQHSNDHG